MIRHAAPKAGCSREGDKTTEYQRVEYRRPMWKASGIDVDSTRDRCGRHRERCGQDRGRCSGTGERCGQHPRSMWTAPGGDISRTETDVDGSGDRFGQRRGRCFSTQARWGNRGQEAGRISRMEPAVIDKIGFLKLWPGNPDSSGRNGRVRFRRGWARIS
ncbi:MAG: hypothetical protein RLZZ214_494 [Verrucomicrobiota bacterium]|jgi:hypothetical protein